MAHAIVTTLSSVRLLRKFIKDLRIPLPTLEKILVNFQSVINELNEEERKAKQEAEKRQTYLANLAKKLEADGIDSDELLKTLREVHANAKPKKKYKTRPAKYQYKDDNGVPKQWSGQGATPKVIKRAIDNGAKLSDFEI